MTIQRHRLEYNRRQEEANARLERDDELAENALAEEILLLSSMTIIDEPDETYIVRGIGDDHDPDSSDDSSDEDMSEGMFLSDVLSAAMYISNICR
jgi:hypothetical protein